MDSLTPYTLRSDALEIRVLPLGAALVGVRFVDQPRNMVLGFEDPSEHATSAIFAGPLVGPVANRLRDGVVDIDGTRHQMPCNENGRTALHSGPDGLNTRTWQLTDHRTDRVALRCVLSDGAGGLPGNRVFDALYRVEGITLHLTVTARTDATTPINVASHPYWNLDGTADVSGHHLTVAAQTYLPVNAHNLPTGAPASVAGTPFDFRTTAAVPLDPSLDVNFCLGTEMHADARPVAVLRGADGTTLRIATNTPGLQVYNGANLPENAPATADFPAVAPYAAIAIEPQHWPDAMHHSAFPNILVKPEETYRQITTFTLQKGEHGTK